MKRWIFSALAFALVSDPGFAQQAPGGPPPAAVRVGEAVERDMAPTLRSPASVLSRSDSRIASEAPGRIVYVAEPGDWVEEGEAVARLDDRQARLQLSEARSRLSRLSENARYQNGEFERWTQLVENGTAPLTRLREVELARNLALQDESEARSAVARAQLDLDRTQVLAPFSGRVVARLIEVGEYSNPGADIVRLVDTANLEARAQVPVSVAPFIAVGDMIEVGDNAVTRQIPIRAIIPVGDRVSRTFEVRLDVEDSPWIVGAGVRAAFPTELPQHVIAVPADAVILRSQGSHVWRVSEEGTAERVIVSTGASDNDYVAVEGALEAGDRVIIRGGETLSDGRPLNILNDVQAENNADDSAADAGPSL